ncbi:MAG: GTP-binding protein [Cyanobacteria bacterium P01_E01_bin.34]
MTQQKLPLKPLLLTAGGFFVLEQAISNLTSLHSAIAPYSPFLANSLTGLLGSATTGLLGFGGYWGWQLLQGQNGTGKKKKRSRRKSTQMVKATPKRVETELGQLDELLNRMQSDVKRKTFKQRARKIGEQLARNQLRLVVFGTSSAGKTSLVNALLGHQVGDTAPTLGTTQTGSIHTYSVPGVGGRIEIADTPGLQAVGRTGESEATLLAKNADLLLFVVSGDMTATEYEQLCTLSAIGKRTLVVFNKTDQYLPDDIDEIVGSLEDKAKPLVPRSHGARLKAPPAVPVVKVAADPMPLKVRQHQADGTIIEVMAERVPETSELKARIKSILKREGNQLRLDNAMQQAKTLADGAAEAISKTRRKRGEAVIQQMQWATAGAIAVNPLPAVDLVAAAAINARTIGKLNKLYGRKITLKRTEQIAKSMGKLLVRIGGVEVATQVMGSALKASPLGAMGIPLQAISSAYLTRVTGLTYLDWLESEDLWDEERMLSRLKAQLQFSGRTEFVQQFMKQALGAVKNSLFAFESAEPNGSVEGEGSDRPPNNLSGLATVSETVDVPAVKAG